MVKSDKLLMKMYVVTLVLFFLSIIFFNIVSEILKKVNLNSISLWSLLMLLVSIYYKDILAAKIVNRLYKNYERKNLDLK